MSPYPANVPHRTEPPSQLRADAVIAATITAFACFGVWTELRYAQRPLPWPPGAYLLAIAAGAALAMRRRRPVATAALCLLGVIGYHLAGYPGLAPAVLAFPACYTLAAYAPRHGLAYGLVAAAAIWALLCLPPHQLPWYALDVSMPALGFGAAAVVGESARRRRLEHQARVRQEAAAAEERLGRRLAEERLNIAQELHDVLAHTISVVAVQSSAALDALDAAPPQVSEAREALTLVRGAARQALPELRAALEMLRGPDAEPRQPLPQPDLSQLQGLVEQVSGSGLAVDLELDNQVAALSPLAQLTAYRIVQEALTNALRHARASHATVRLARQPGHLLVQVTDDGSGAGAEARGAEAGGAEGGGFGLRGMRERAEALGGRFDAGSLPVAGFEVRAELPWDAP